MKVSDLMSRDVFTCALDDPVLNVTKKMLDQDLGLLVVVEDNLAKRPTGVVTDQDILEKVIMKKLDPSKVTAGQIATKKIVSIQPTASITDATAAMKKNKVKRLIVIDNLGNLTGIISQTDFIKQFVKIRDQLVDLSSGL